MLEARGLWVAPPGTREAVVRDLSLTIASGEWIAFAGPNGGGKSTVLHALAGLWAPQRGTVTLDGDSLATGAAARRRIGVVLQDPSTQLLQPTVREELAFAGRNLGLDRARLDASVDRLAGALALEPDLGRDPTTLSAGRQQVVLLAAALVAEPAVLIADEPTAHLDAETRQRVLELLADRLRDGLAVAWATQDPAEVARATRTIQVGAPPSESGIARIERARFPSGEPVLSLAIGLPGLGAKRVSVREPRTLTIRRGEITALVGPNAAGKSLVLASAAGLESLDQVRVTWIAPPAAPPIVALQYPELQIFEEVVADELIFAAVARGVSRPDAHSRAADLLESLGLEPARFLSRRTWTLSTGEQRLMTLIGALIAPASVVILDEPTAGLDPDRKRRIGRLLIERAASDPILVATQDEAWLSGLGVGSIRIG